MFENIIPITTTNSLGSLDKTSVGEYNAQTLLHPNRIKRETPGIIIDLDGLGGGEVSPSCSILEEESCINYLWSTTN